MPDPTPRSPRRDDTSADTASLERMARLAPQPVPWSDLFLEPPPLPEPEE